MSNDYTPMVECPSCHTKAPAGTDLCPNCGKRMPIKWGFLSDAQIKRIRRPVSIVVWAIIAIVILYRFFVSKA